MKSVNSEVLFGASPQGNLQNNYDFMYADVKKWCSEEGYLDYIVPQIYFGYENSVQPFYKVADEWNDIIKSDKVSLVIGLAPYKIGGEDEFIEKQGIITNQIKRSQNLSNYSGFALYNYINIFEVDESLQKRMQAEEEAIKNAHVK